MDIIFNIIENVVMTSKYYSICSDIYILMGGYHDREHRRVSSERADQLNTAFSH